MIVMPNAVEYPGVVKLTSSDTAIFSSYPTLQGSSYKSISLSVISLTTGTVTINDGTATTDVSYPGLSIGWEGLLNPVLSIEVTGDAVAVVTYIAH